MAQALKSPSSHTAGLTDIACSPLLWEVFFTSITIIIDFNIIFIIMTIMNTETIMIIT